MPSSSPSHQCSQAQPAPPDPIALAAMLQNAAQALLSSPAPRESPSPDDEGDDRPREEIRSYRFSPLALRGEKELLEEQNAEGLRELVSMASSSIMAFASLLELMDEAAKVDGFVIHILARELQRIGDLFFKIQDVYSTVELVET